MSKAAQLAQKSKLYIAGSSGSAEVLTAITVGYPTILAITGHAGVANGDVITLAGFTGADAATLNGKTPVATHYATGASNDTFAIDIDTTGLTITIDAGNTTATPALWTQIKEVKAIKPGGATATKIDVTDLDSDAKEYRTGLVDNGTLSADIFDKTSDAGQQAVLASFNAQTVCSYKLALTGGSTRTFDAVVTKFPTNPDAAVDSVQTGTIEWQITGAVTRS